MRRVHLLTALELPPTTPDGDYEGVQAAATLALFGWTMVAEERGAGKGQQAVLSCELCFRQAGALRSPRARLAARSAWAVEVSIPLRRPLNSAVQIRRQLAILVPQRGMGERGAARQEASPRAARHHRPR